MITGFLLVLACAAVAYGAPAPAQPSAGTDPMFVAGYFQGDMRFKKGLEPRSGIIGPQFRWPNATVPIEMDSTFTAEEFQIVMGGFNELMNKTCVRIVTRSTQENYVRVIRGEPNSGCWSWVGLQGGMQELNLQAGTPGCIRHGVSAHEMLHALGFFHEQSRSDRDDYVVINWNNIQAGLEHNFDKYNSSVVDPYNVPYDYGSVMHYPPYGFAINPNIPTIYGPAGIGQRDRVSDADALKVNRMYNCP